MLDRTFAVVGIVIGIILFVVVASSLTSGGLGSQLTCPTQGQGENSLQEMLRNACGFVGSFGGVIIIISSIIGMVVYIYYFRQ